MKYFKNLKTNSLYRAEEIKFSDGTPSTKLERWNWDMECWGGHIHDHEKTRLQIEEGVVIIPITKENIDELLN